MLGYQPWRYMKHNLIVDVVMKPRWCLKIVWENFVVNNLRFFFYVRIVKGPKTNIFKGKLCAWVIFIVLFTRLLWDNSNSLTYEQRKAAKSNTFTCQLCDSTSHADWLAFHNKNTFKTVLDLVRVVTWMYEDLFRFLTNALKKGSCLLRSNSF